MSFWRARPVGFVPSAPGLLGCVVALAVWLSLSAQPALAGFSSELGPLRALNDTADGVSNCIVGHPTRGANCVDPDGAGPLQLGDGHQYHDVFGVAFDSQGNYFVCEDRAKQIRKFNADDVMVAKWSVNGGAYNDHRGVAVDSQDNVWVITYRDNVLKKFDNDGNPLASFTLDGRLSGIHIDERDNIFISNDGPAAGRVRKYDLSGNLLLTISNINNPYGVATDSQGNIYVASGSSATFDNRRHLKKYDPAGNLLATLDTITEANFVPFALAVDELDQVWVNGRQGQVRVYASNLSHLFSFGDALDPHVRLGNATALAFTRSGDELYVYSSGPLDLAKLAVWGAPFDVDADTLSDHLDNCPSTANADQLDGDDDGLGDACDACPSDPGERLCVVSIDGAGQCLSATIRLEVGDASGEVSVNDVDFESVDFVNANGATDEDILAPEVRLTRGASGPVYNAGTDAIEWAAGPCSDVTSPFLSSLTYLSWSGYLPGLRDLPGLETCLRVVATEQLYTFHWISWSTGGSGFAYTRERSQLIPLAVESYASSDLPDSVDISGVADGEHALCVTATGQRPACLTFTQAGETRIVINGACDDEGPVISNLVALPNPLIVGSSVELYATVDDSDRGASVITSAAVTVDGLPGGVAIARDGAFDEIVEDVSATTGPFAAVGEIELCVWAADAAGNIGEVACTSVRVVTAEELAVMELEAALEAVTSTPDDALDDPGHRESMANHIAQALAAIDAGRVMQAIGKLDDVIARTDGCALRGAPDGGGPGRDWVTDCAAQDDLYALLLSAIASLGG